MPGFAIDNSLEWEYETFGRGNELLLAFHGFGNHGSDFRVFEPALSARYTVISFTLPFHGREMPLPPTPIKPETLGAFILEFVKSKGAESFSLMGYSLGGKIALQLIELFPGRIRDVFLFAPDGLRPAYSNAFITRSLLGKKIYASILRNPSGLFRLVGILEKSRLLHAKVGAFLRDSLSTHEKRERVWNVWVYFRDIRPSAKRVQTIVNKQDIRMHLFFGEYDKIIPPSVGAEFAKGLKQKDALHVIEAGHNLFKEILVDELIKAVGERQDDRGKMSP